MEWDLASEHLRWGEEGLDQQSNYGGYLQHTSTMTIAKEKISAPLLYVRLPFKVPGAVDCAFGLYVFVLRAFGYLYNGSWFAGVVSIPTRPKPVIRGRPEPSTRMADCPDVNTTVRWALERVRTPLRLPWTTLQEWR